MHLVSSNIVVVPGSVARTTARWSSWAGAALVISARLRRIRVGNSDSVRTKLAESVASLVVRRCGYLGKLELDN